MLEVTKWQILSPCVAFHLNQSVWRPWQEQTVLSDRDSWGRRSLKCKEQPAKGNSCSRMDAVMFNSAAVPSSGSNQSTIHLAKDDLWSQVLRSATQRPGPTFDSFGKAKVCDLKRAKVSILEAYPSVRRKYLYNPMGMSWPCTWIYPCWSISRFSGFRSL